MATYILEDLFPVHRTSLICGPSGAGKSRWLLPTIADWREGKDILGKKSHPLPCAYIACDRPSEATYELIEDLGLGTRLKDMPIFSLMDVGKDFEYAKIPPMVKPTGAEVIFIEAFQALIPNGEISKYWHVLNFFRTWNQVCKLNNLTPIGSCHQPKTRENEGYSLQRDKIMGTVAWGAACEGIIGIEYAQPNNLDCSLRTLTVLPRNRKPWTLSMDFNESGHLTESQQDIQVGELILTQELRKYEDGSIITTIEVKQWCMKKGVSERSMYRWLQSSPHLTQVKRGHYKYAADVNSNDNRVN